MLMAAALLAVHFQTESSRERGWRVGDKIPSLLWTQVDSDCTSWGHHGQERVDVKQIISVVTQEVTRERRRVNTQQPTADDIPTPPLRTKLEQGQSLLSEAVSCYPPPRQN